MLAFINNYVNGTSKHICAKIFILTAPFSLKVPIISDWIASFLRIQLATIKSASALYGTVGEILLFLNK